MGQRINITKRDLEKLALPDGDVVQWDRKLEGFGVRRSPNGRVTFVVQYRIGRQSRRITIGTYGKWTPATAREAAEELLRQAAAARKGLAQDPADRAREIREAITFQQLADEYMERARAGHLVLPGRTRGKSKKLSTVAIDGYRIKHLTAHFRQQPVRTITRVDCERCLDRLIEGKHGASRTFGLLGGIFSFAVRQGYITSNPAHGVTTPADGKREFRLEVDGYRALGKALEAAEAQGESWQAVAAIRLLALTGTRKSEVLRLKLSEIDLAGRCLRLGDTKTGASLRVLGEPALRLVRELVNRGGRPHSEYLFPGRDPRKPFNGLGGTFGGAWERIVGGTYTPHGLRHAFASACEDVELSELTVATLLGHRSARTGSTTRGYIKKADAVLVAAVDKVTRHIWEAMTGERFGAEIHSLRSA